MIVFLIVYCTLAVVFGYWMYRKACDDLGPIKTVGDLVEVWAFGIIFGALWPLMALPVWIATRSFWNHKLKRAR